MTGLGIRWAVASRALDGASRSGDQALVAERMDDALVAVVDGLGHGDAAASVADLATTELRAHSEAPIEAIVQRCHAALIGTRGVALSLAVLNGHQRTLSWLGVGNVIGVVVRDAPGGRAESRWLTLRGGIVGAQLPVLRASVLPIEPGDTLVFATDGVRPEWPDELRVGEPRHMADRLLARYGVPTDDALVLVVRYGGAAA